MAPPHHQEKYATMNTSLHSICFGIGFVVGFFQDLATLGIIFLSSPNTWIMDGIFGCWVVFSTAIILVAYLSIRALVLACEEPRSPKESTSADVTMPFFAGTLTGVSVSWFVTRFLMTGGNISAANRRDGLWCLVVPLAFLGAFRVLDIWRRGQNTSEEEETSYYVALLDLHPAIV